VRREHAVGAHDLAAGFLADDEVVAVRVELVDVFGRPVQGGAEFLGEHAITQPLCGAHLGTVGGDQKRVAGGFTRCGDGENGHAYGVRPDLGGWLTAVRFLYGGAVNCPPLRVDHGRGQAGATLIV
jgi:hypothetical protein